MTKHLKEFQRLKNAGWSFYQRGDYRTAATHYREARLLAEAHEDHINRVEVLYWEGDSLAAAGDFDISLATLLEGATADPTRSNPVDIFNCWISAVDRCIKKKSYQYLRQHLEELHLFLEKYGLSRVIHKLYFTEADVELTRRNLEAARNKFLLSWETHIMRVPYYTQATHLYSLCYTLFLLRDEPSLSRWVKTIEEIDYELAQDRLKAKLARLMLCRARRFEGKEAKIARSVAKETMSQIDAMNRDTSYFEESLLRVFLRLGEFALVEQRLSKLGDNEFTLSVFYGDLALSRARVALGLPLVDDEWEAKVAPPTEITPSFEAAGHLEAAALHYQDAIRWAKDFEEKLETRWYTEDLQERLARVAALQSALARP